MAIQRSVDNVTWATLVTVTSLQAQDGVDLLTEGFIRVYITTNTTGANLTVELEYGSDPKIRPNFSSTHEADHSFLPLCFKSTATGVGTVSGLFVKLESTGALHYYDNAIYAHMHCNVSAGNLRNPVAVQGDLTFASGCWVQGLGYGIGTYITLPPSACTTGTFTGIQVEFNAPASYTGAASPVISCFRVTVGGDATALTSLETNLALFSVTGVTEGTGRMFSSGADVAAANTLRCLVNGVARYILLANGESN
jgi:hypothetical protein